jgi:hypothetical protein
LKKYLSLLNFEKIGQNNFSNAVTKYQLPPVIGTGSIQLRGTSYSKSKQSQQNFHRTNKYKGFTKKRLRSRLKVLTEAIPECSVAEPELEPMKQQLFAGAGAKVFLPGSGAGYVNSLKMLHT